MMVGKDEHARHWVGIILVAASALAWSSAGIFTKGVTADVWAVLFWRGLFGAIFVFIYVAWREGRKTFASVGSLGWPGWAIATTGSIATVAFIASFKLTAVANVVLIYATAPFAAAALAWIAFGEKSEKSILVASAIALVGVAIMSGGSLGSPHLIGDLLAVVMTFFMAGMMVLIRRYPAAPSVLAAGTISSLQIMMIGGLLGEPFAIAPGEIGLLAAFGLVQALGIILLTEGARRIPASLAALIGALEISLAILFAWLILAEVPVLATVAGGIIVSLAVVAQMRNSWLKSSRRPLSSAAVPD